MREKIGNYCLDLSKLIFGGVILNITLGVQSVPIELLFVFGLIGMLGLAVLGLALQKGGQS